MRSGVLRGEDAQPIPSVSILASAPKLNNPHRQYAARDNGSGEVHIERRIIRGPNQNEDVIVRRGPDGIRAEVRGPRFPEGPFALPMRPMDKGQAEHLEQAIRHLHDAGMDELANRLQARLDNQRGHGDEARLHEEIERLKEEQ